VTSFWCVVTNDGAINGFLVWVLYLALEPRVRRRWPQTMISWSRYTVKGWRDPLVGRALLYSVGVGVVLGLLDLLQSVLRGSSVPPLFPGALFNLMGVPLIISSMLVALGGDVINSLLIFFVLFLSRVVLRKEWIAVSATIAIVGGINYAPGGMRLADLPFEIALLGILTVVMLRFGLIAAIFGYAGFVGLWKMTHLVDERGHRRSGLTRPTFGGQPN
jgi:serine/threonine-protein kinase